MSFKVKQLVFLKLINRLGVFFSIYLTILNEQVRKNKSFSKLEELPKQSWRGRVLD